MKKYILSSDNGYHWHTSVMFGSIEDAVVYFVNERLGEYNYDWKKVSIKEVSRPIKDVQSYIEVHIIAIEFDGYEVQETVYISEMTENHPEDKHNVIELGK